MPQAEDDPVPRESLYERYLLPYLIDLACGIGPVRRQREKIVPMARGRVLEIGMGSGLNLCHYRREQVETLVSLEPASGMHRLARRRIQQSGLDVDWLPLSAESIPAGDNSFDSIVITYTLCTIPDVEPALLEMFRVLAPGGQLLFAEHGAAPDPAVRRWQDRLDPWWGRFAGGCHLNREVPELIANAGFSLDSLEQLYLPGPRPLTWNSLGVARKSVVDAV